MNYGKLSLNVAIIVSLFMAVIALVFQYPMPGYVESATDVMTLAAILLLLRES